jgi:Rod binding domain-containing protein
MEVTGINRHVQPGELPLEKLATSTQISDQDKIAEVSRQFEAVLLRQILTQAQKPLFKSALLESDNSTNSIYQDIITTQLADRISQGGTFGFAKVLNVQLAAQCVKKDEAAQRTEQKTASGLPHRDTAVRGAVPPASRKTNLHATESRPKELRHPAVYSPNRPVPPAPLKPFSDPVRRLLSPSPEPRTTPASQLPRSAAAPSARVLKLHEPQPGKRI